METEHGDRRRATRYPIEAKVMVKHSGESIPATAANISAAGMLLHVEQPSRFSVDDEVTVDVELPENLPEPLSTWGVARIVRIDGHHFGIHLSAGTFSPRDLGNLHQNEEISK